MTRKLSAIPLCLTIFNAATSRAYSQDDGTAAAPSTQQQTPPPTTAAAPTPQPAPPPSDDSKSTPVHRGGRVEQATLVHMVHPVYPNEAKDAHISGTVVVKGVIAKDGSVKNIEAVSGPDELRQAAIDAVKQWQYNPTTVAGEPVDVNTTVELV